MDYHMDYHKKYLKYKNKYMSLKSELNMMPNSITNVSVVKPTIPTVPNPASNTPVI